MRNAFYNPVPHGRVHKQDPSLGFLTQVLFSFMKRHSSISGLKNPEHLSCTTEVETESMTFGALLRTDCNGVVDRLVPVYDTGVCGDDGVLMHVFQGVV